ncbi:MAG: response regulator [Gammaproteobacteria bacterium]|nr:response regulator [Gammaproteobacteria bacterium]
MPLPKKLALVVDDDVYIRAAIKKILLSFGFDVVEAVNGKDGVEKFRQQKFDLVTMDFMMPELNGAEAAKKIREQNKDILIIGLSSSYRRMETECRRLNFTIPVLSKFEMPDVLTDFIRGLCDERKEDKDSGRY